jgi:hypothetical protein
LQSLSAEIKRASRDLDVDSGGRVWYKPTTTPLFRIAERDGTVWLQTLRGHDIGPASDRKDFWEAVNAVANLAFRLEELADAAGVKKKDLVFDRVGNTVSARAGDVEYRYSIEPRPGKPWKLSDSIIVAGEERRLDFKAIKPVLKKAAEKKPVKKAGHAEDKAAEPPPQPPVAEKPSEPQPPEPEIKTEESPETTSRQVEQERVAAIVSDEEEEKILEILKVVKQAWYKGDYTSVRANLILLAQMVEHKKSLSPQWRDLHAYILSAYRLIELGGESDAYNSFMVRLVKAIEIAEEIVKQKEREAEVPQTAQTISETTDTLGSLVFRAEFSGRNAEAVVNTLLSFADLEAGFSVWWDASRIRLAGLDPSHVTLIVAELPEQMTSYYGIERPGFASGAGYYAMDYGELKKVIKGLSRIDVVTIEIYEKALQLHFDITTAGAMLPVYQLMKRHTMTLSLISAGTENLPKLNLNWNVDIRISYRYLAKAVKSAELPGNNYLTFTVSKEGELYLLHSWYMGLKIGRVEALVQASEPFSASYNVERLGVFMKILNRFAEPSTEIQAKIMVTGTSKTGPMKIAYKGTPTIELYIAPTLDAVDYKMINEKIDAVRRKTAGTDFGEDSYIARLEGVSDYVLSEMRIHEIPSFETCLRMVLKNQKDTKAFHLYMVHTYEWGRSLVLVGDGYQTDVAVLFRQVEVYKYRGSIPHYEQVTIESDALRTLEKLLKDAGWLYIRKAPENPRLYFTVDDYNGEHVVIASLIEGDKPPQPEAWFEPPPMPLVLEVRDLDIPAVRKKMSKYSTQWLRLTVDERGLIIKGSLKSDGSDAEEVLIPAEKVDYMQPSQDIYLDGKTLLTNLEIANLASDTCTLTLYSGERNRVLRLETKHPDGVFSVVITS